MTTECRISEKIFKDFTIFNILKRNKYYRSPITFMSLLSISAIICFIMHKVDGAIILGTVLLIVGLGVPVVYFATFFSSLKKQIKKEKLNPPRHAYTITMLDQKDGILVSNEKEKATYKWDNVYQIYLNKECLYLFMTKNRAFLIPYADMKENKDSILKIINKRCKEKIKSIS